MHINVLTDEIKNQVIEKLNKFNKNFIVNTEPKTGYILKLLKQPHKPEYARQFVDYTFCLLYTSPSPRDRTRSRMPSSA